MATPTISRLLSYSEVVVRGLIPRTEAPYQVGELVYATVFVESPMAAFRSSCGPKPSKQEERHEREAAEERQLKEEKGETDGKGARPCIILSTKRLPKDNWEYELCLLTSFDNKAWSELPEDEKRLALPVQQEGDQPNECEDETRIRAFELKPPMKPRPKKPHAYLIGYPITRPGRCLDKVKGDVKPFMEPDEVKRLKEHCDWIMKHKREVSKPKPLSSRDRLVKFGSISRVDSPLSYQSTGDISAGPVAGPSGVSRSVEDPTVPQAPKRRSGSGASQIIGQFLSSAGNIIKRAASAVSSLSSRSSGSK